MSDPSIHDSAPRAPAALLPARPTRWEALSRAAERAAPPEYRVFIVDDHAVIRSLLAQYIGTEPGLRVCGTAASGAEALERLGEVACDLALVDITMPGMDGIELVRHLRSQHPGLACLMLSSHIARAYVEAALEAGASGYTTKEEPDALIEAIWRVLRGEPYLSEEVRRLRSEA